MAAKVINFKESNLIERFCLAINEVPTQQVSPDCVEDTFKFITMGFSYALRSIKQKENPVAVVVNNMGGKFLFGVKIIFIPGEDKEAGSWNTIWSFNEDDFKEDGLIIYRIEDPKIEPFFTAAAATYHLQIWPSSGTAYTLERVMFETIISYLDQNAVDTNGIVLKLDGFFEATVDIVDGVKVFNFIPDEEITNLAKGDGDIISTVA